MNTWRVNEAEHLDLCWEKWFEVEIGAKGAGSLSGQGRRVMAVDKNLNKIRKMRCSKDSIMHCGWVVNRWMSLMPPPTKIVSMPESMNNSTTNSVIKL